MANKQYGNPPRYPEAAYGGQNHYDAGPYQAPQGAAADYYGGPSPHPAASPYQQGPPYGGPPPQHGGYYGGPPQGMQYGPPGPGYAPQGRFAHDGRGGGGGAGNAFLAACAGTLALCCCLDCLF